MLGLLLALPAMVPFALAGSFAGASNTILPGVVNTGGQGGVSASHNLTGVVDEPGQSAYTSANNILQPGFAALMAWPDRITDLSASTGEGEGSVNLTWTSPKADGYTGTAAAYEIRLSSVPARSPAISEGQFLLASSAADFVTVPAPAAYGSTEQLTVPGLVGGATYYFAVKARASWDAWSYLSAGATAQTLLYAPSPAGFPSVSAGSARFNWSDAANVSGTHYRVLVSTAPDPLDPGGAIVTSSDTYNLYLSSSGLMANTAYYFRVAGINNGNVQLSYSAASSTSTLLANAPALPGFTEVAATSVRFGWSNNGNAYPGTNYRVVYSTAVDPFNPDGAAVYYGGTAERYLTVAGLDANTTYYFSVAGENNDGVATAYTAVIATSTLANVPVFAGFTDVQSVSAQFNWSANGNPDWTLYRVVASSAADPLNPGSAPVSEIYTYDLFYSSSGLFSDTDYYFRAAAISNDGTLTGYSAAEKVSTLQVTAPVFQAAGTAKSGTGSVTPAWPTHQKDDIALLFVESANQAVTLTAANGFVAVANSPQGVGTAAGTSATRLSVFWARATSSSMSSPVIADPGDHLYAIILTFRYVVKNGDPWDVSVGGTKGTASTSLTIPGITTTVSDTLVVAAVTKQLDATASFVSNWSNANLTNITERTDAGTTSGNGGGVAVMTGAKSLPGAIGNTSVALTSSINAYISLALRPDPPLLPPNISGITDVSARDITAAWNLVSDATGYTLAASLTSDNPPEIYASSITLGDLSATVDTPVLSPDTTYYLFVQANGSGKSSEWSAFLGTSTLLEYEPASPVLSNVTAGSIQFDWSNNGNAPDKTRYRVYVSTAADPLDPAGAAYTSTDTYSLSMSSSGLMADSLYYFRVGGLNHNDVSTAYTAAVSTYTLLAYPPALSGFTEVSTGSVRFNWAHNGNASGTLYRAEVSASADMSDAAAYDSYGLSLSSGGLAANTTYYFRAAGLSKGGVVTAYTDIASTSTLARSAAGLYIDDVGETAMKFGWAANGNPSALTRYRMLVSTASDPLEPGSALATSSETYDLSLTSSALLLNTTYYFRVAAINNNGVITDYSAALSSSTFAAAPSGLSLQQVSSCAARLDWSGGANPAGTMYHVVYSSAADPLVPGAARAFTADTTGYFAPAAGLEPNTSYYFKVAAISNNGLPTAYAALSTTTLAARPADLYFSGLSSYTAVMNWSAPGNPQGETLYRVAVSTAPDPLVPGDAAVYSYETYDAYLAPSGLAANTTYYFRVSAVNRRGLETAYSAAASSSTLAAQPSDMYFTGTTQNATQANWDTGSNGPGTLYRVAVSTAADPLAPAGARVTFHDTYDAYLSTSGLTYFTDYYFRVAAVNNNALPTAYSAPAAVKTLAPGQIGSPASGSIDAVYISSISASWSLVSGATGYTLAASLSPDSPPAAVFASSVTLGAGAVSASVYSPALSADTTYYLFVHANGPMSAGAWFAFPGAATRLQYPPVSAAFTSVSSSAVRFSWSANGNPAGTLYQVLVSTAADPLAPGDSEVLSSDTYNSYADFGALAANTTYFYRVAGVNKGGLLTDYTAPAATSTLAGAPEFSGFTGVGAAAMQFNWTSGGNPDGTIYRVLTSTAFDPLSPAGAVVASSDTYALSLNSSGLEANTGYYFRVAAINNNGVATAYTVVAGTATRLAYSPVFSGFSSVTAGSIQFAWTDMNPAGTLYRVYVSTSEDPLTAGSAAVSWSETYNLSLSSAGLSANTTYYFRVAGINESNVPTAYTAAAGTATLANLPLSGVSTFSAVTESSFNAAWDPNSNPSGTLYIVQVSTASDFNPGAVDQVLAATAPLSGTSYDFSGLSPFTRYYFQVMAVNGNGVPTAYVQLGSTVTLSLSAPSGAAVIAVTTYSVAAAWQLAASATGYTLAASTMPDNPPWQVVVSSSVTGDSAVFTALDLNTTYYLFIRSEGAGLSSPWAVFPATSTLANAALSAVPAFTAVGYNGFTVNWGNNSNPLDSTLYDVEISTAYNFDDSVTDQMSITTAPASGPSATFDSMNAGTFYYARVRTRGHGGTLSAWRELGVQRTKYLPTLHAAGDGVMFYGQAGNTLPQFLKYSGSANTFVPGGETVAGEAGTLYVIKTSPLQTKQEAVAAYVAGSTLHVLCTDGTNWSEEWTQNMGGDASTRRFDIAYETDSGDVMVLYSQGQAATNELGYRTKPGASVCGDGNWSAHNDLNTTGTSGVVQWVKMASDRRASSDNLAAIWADASSDLTARIWNGDAWESEPSSALETSLETVSSAQDVEDFDVDFESLSGNAMVVWANSGGNNGTNGMRYAVWTELTRTWGAASNPTTSGDDATNLDLAANPASNEMVFASVGNAGGTGSADLRGGYWSGSAWTLSALDTSCQLPLARTKMVAAGWVSSGTYTRSVIAYHDAAATNVGWYVGNGATFTQQTDASPAPAFGVPQTVRSIQQDPVNLDRIVMTVSDARTYLYAKRAVMNSAGVFSWSDANTTSILDTAISTGTIGAFSFAFWPAPPVTTYVQSAYRFFANNNAASVGTALADQDTLASVDTAGSVFRLRTGLHVGQVDLAAGGQGFKLQFAGRGDGTCEEPANGLPPDYTDVGSATAMAFADNPAVSGGTALTANASDPRHGGHTNVNQTYVEGNDFTNSVAGISRQQDGMWDFALKDNGMTPGAVYCLRIVKADGSLLNSYGVYPQVMVKAPVYINEVYPSGADGEDWVELYNNTASTPALTGWTLQYVENTIDIGGSATVLWTGQAGEVINAYSTYTVTGSTLVGTQSYHVRLLDAGGNTVDLVQWPVLSSGRSFARNSDGGATYFNIDPTPTKGYANSVSTDQFKINEVSYGALGTQFIEIYNASAVSTRTLAGYTLRNSAGASRGLFKLGRRIYPHGYAVVDFSSLDVDGKTYTDAFGPGGLSAAGDFLVLENSTGSVVDMVTWQSDTNYTQYNYNGSTGSFPGAAPANAASSIGRGPQEGYDSGADQTDFTAQPFTTLASRNNSAAGAAANALAYPANSSAAQYLARVFPLTFAFGADSRGGNANNIVFQRTGGMADPYSPHLYRLADIGFNPASLAAQTTVQTGSAFYDQDGGPLAAGATYRVTFNTDNGTASAPQIILSTLTYDAAVHAVTGSNVAPRRMNNASRAALLKFEVSNNSLPGGNGIYLATAAFRLMDSEASGALAAVTANTIFNAIMLVRDSTTTGVSGVYESAIDISTVAYIPKGSISLDSGVSTLAVTSAGRPAAFIAAASTGTFFVVVEATGAASTNLINAFAARFPAAGPARVFDASGGLEQAYSASAQVDTSSVTIIAPASSPAGTSWPYALAATVVSTAPAAYYSNEGVTSVSSSVYVTTTDGYLRAFKKDGSPKWAFATGSLLPIRTSPLAIVEGAGLFLYFADDNGDIYKVADNESGAALSWKKHIGAAIKSGIMCADTDCSGDRFYFGAADNTVRCLLKDTGDACASWTLSSAVTAEVAGTISVDGRDSVNSAWVGLEDGRVVNLRLSDGYSPTAFDRAGAAIKTSPLLDAWSAYANNTLFFTSTDGKLYARVASNLSQTPAGWTDYNAGAPIYSSPFKVVGSLYVFFGDDAGRLHKVSSEGVTASGWPFQAGGAIRSSPVMVPSWYLGNAVDYVYFGCDDGFIYALNANTGALRDGWPVATGGAVRADPVVDPDAKTLILPSGDGKTYVIYIGP